VATEKRNGVPPERKKQVKETKPIKIPPGWGKIPPDKKK
jgi:hypothetical protein